MLHARYELHAGIDISDGLSLDLAHVVEESGCGAVVHMDAVPVADDARRLGRTTGRRLDAAGSRAGRRRGFRVDPGRAAGARRSGCSPNSRWACR